MTLMAPHSSVPLAFSAVVFIATLLALREAFPLLRRKVVMLAVVMMLLVIGPACVRHTVILGNAIYMPYDPCGQDIPYWWYLIHGCWWPW